MYTADELRSQSEKELKELLLQLRRLQLNMRIQVSIGQFADVSKFKENRRDVARIKTVLNEKASN